MQATSVAKAPIGEAFERAMQARTLCEAFQITASARADQVALRTADDSVSFTYRANDGHVNSAAPATVTITVNAVNDVPAATNDSYSTNEDTALTIAAPGVLGNDTNVDGGQLTAVLVSGPTAAQGTLTLNSNGSFVEFTTRVGLPNTLTEVGLRADDADALKTVADAATAEGETIHAMPFTVRSAEVVSVLASIERFATSHVAAAGCRPGKWSLATAASPRSAVPR